MARGELLRKDWFLALVFSLLFLIGVVNGAGLLDGLEDIAYDTGLKAANRIPGAAEHIAIVAIDDDSIRKIGPWPWPRSVLADMVDRLAAAKAKVIGLQVSLGEPQTDPGLTHIRRISAALGRAAQSGAVGSLIRQAEQELNTDRRLAAAIPAAGNVLLPVYFTLGRPDGKRDAPLPEYMQRNHLPRVFARTANVEPPYSTKAASVPLAELGQNAAGIGHLNLIADGDGAIRSDALALEYYGDYYPSLALLLAARSLNLRPSDITVNLGEGVRLGNLNIRTDERLRMYTSFYRRTGDGTPFATYSFADVRDGKIRPEEFGNRIVIVGLTAPRIGDRYMTPIRDTMEGPVLTAQAVASILNQDFYTRPAWTLGAEAAIYLAILAYLMFGLTRMPTAAGAVVSFSLLLALLAGGHYLLLREQLWLKTVSPALLLLFGHALLATKRYFLTRRQKRRVEADSAQTNRMLGLAFQNQGQLDMALDKFRALPVDQSVLDLIYNLALDFERKRQFSKAASAYDYILGHDPNFRDAGERRVRARKMDGAIILGGGHVAPGGTLVLDQVDHKPTLGRYEVEKELGKGAMGAVYLGRDPRINRVVAIKTMALSAEFEGTDLAQARERFFREAETAGRLNHPNIVTIYDAGEEHDLAYIAMEYLEGQDLTKYTDPGCLLPIDDAVHILGQIAEALAYAHAQGVVHRDIKPANIMYETRTRTIKVADFGIARITAAASRTLTGVVLGTPSHMSPEQLAGKRVDGRSDLFSLGVLAFELFTGHPPFDGDTLATLTYQIANAQHPDATELRPELPTCLRGVLDRALAKDPDQRYQSGTEFTEALHQCLRSGARKQKKRTGVA